MTQQKQSQKYQSISFAATVARQEKRKEQQQQGESHPAAASYHEASDADDDEHDDDESKRAVVSSKTDKISGIQNGRVETDQHVQNKTTTTTRDTGELVWFVREEERWELTWPIWHMLPRAERKALAVQHGFETIGEFEEYMTLQRAVGDSSEQNTYENALAYGISSAVRKSTPSTTTTTTTESSRGPAHTEMHPHPDKKLPGYDDYDDDASDTNEQLEEKMESELMAAASDKLSTSELVKVGGLILLLPDEMLHRIFDWLPVDTYATLALVSPHWKSFTRTEAVYKRLCERLYLNQSKRRALHVSRFGNSYHTMLQQRPRVRAGGGVYVLKYSRVKHIQRDMWTEVRTKQGETEYR